MLERTRFDEDFYNEYNEYERPVIVYGAGGGYKDKTYRLPDKYIIVDKNVNQVFEHKVYDTDILENLTEDVYIIVTVKSTQLYNEILSELEGQVKVNARVFHLYNNIAFCDSYYETAVSYIASENDKPMKINIVCRDHQWILSKFANRLEWELKKLNVDVSLTDSPRGDVDINHHIQFATYESFPNDTVMISHVDSMKLFKMLRHQLETVALGICMSKDTMDKLISYGIERDKLCYINPAHDGTVIPKKYVVGITHRCYEWVDVRKRVSSLIDIVKEGVSPKFFRFVIMGSGWERVIDSLVELGFEVQYYPEFEYETYMKIIPSFDYYLFMGFDEGSMGYLDALAAGVGTIVTPQGFHLDNKCEIDYPCSSIEEFRAAFIDLQNKRLRKISSVKDWTWESYAKKHVELWEYILHRKTMQDLHNNQMKYSDGIFSTFLEDNRVETWNS